MVLWEITLGTAYFLGLRRTYRLALKIQRRLVSPNHPKTRQFLHSRTRSIFDMALRVHHTVQERDLEVGRNVGNWILRWLDRMKPSAEIRPSKPPVGSRTTKHPKSPGPNQRSIHSSAAPKSGGRFLANSLAIRSKSFPTLSMLMRPLIPVSTNIQHRHLSVCRPDIPVASYGSGAFEGVIRKDIVQWLLRK